MMQLQEQLARLHKNVYSVIKIQVTKQSSCYPILLEVRIIIIQLFKKTPKPVWAHIFQLPARKETMELYLKQTNKKPTKHYNNIKTFFFFCFSPESYKICGKFTRLFSAMVNIFYVVAYYGMFEISFMTMQPVISVIFFLLCCLLIPNWMRKGVLYCKATQANTAASCHGL